MRSIWNALTMAGLAAVMVGGLLMTTGCGGGGATYQAASGKTLGEELEDLQKSRDKGIITQKEYEDTKKKLIKKYTNY